MRVIARIDVKNEYAIKGVHLEGVKKVGDPNELALKYYVDGVDEIIFMDAVASLYNRNNLFKIIENACTEVFIPVTIGGGIRTLDDIEKALHSGADKVAINTGAVNLTIEWGNENSATAEITQSIPANNGLTLIIPGLILTNGEVVKAYASIASKILIAGFGRIGQNLIKRCLGFEMKVNVYDPFVTKEKIESLGGKKIDNLNSSLSTADYFSIHMPLNNETKNLINLKMLKTMKKSAIIINTARGGIVNEQDLDLALNEKIIFAAGLDVFEKEPPNSDNVLLKNPRVLLSPHSATFTKECKSRMSIETVQNIIDFFENKIKKDMVIKL